MANDEEWHQELTKELAAFLLSEEAHSLTPDEVGKRQNAIRDRLREKYYPPFRPADAKSQGDLANAQTKATPPSNPAEAERDVLLAEKLEVLFATLAEPGDSADRNLRLVEAFRQVDLVKAQTTRMAMVLEMLSVPGFDLLPPGEQDRRIEAVCLGYEPRPSRMTTIERLVALEPTEGMTQEQFDDQVQAIFRSAPKETPPRARTLRQDVEQTIAREKESGHTDCYLLKSAQELLALLDSAEKKTPPDAKP